MRVRTLSVAAISAAALALSTLAVGTAGAAGTSGATATPSGVSAYLSSGSPVAASGSVAAAPTARPKCNTAFGTPVEDGIFSSLWSGLDVAGAADFQCDRRKKKTRTFGTVTVQGTNGDAPQQNFNVTVWANSTAGAIPEPANTIAPVCATQSAVGTPTGSSFPTFDTTVISLPQRCTVPRAAKVWLEVQAVPVGGSPWYWRTQAEVGSKYQADWRDTVGFGTACAPGYGDDNYMQTCVFGGDVGENDFMFVLSR